MKSKCYTIESGDLNGVKCWRKGDKFHRINGPAVIYPDGHREWWKDGVKIKHIDIAGYTHYFNHKGQIHRLEGPAIISSDPPLTLSDGTVIGLNWFINGQEIDVNSQEEFEKTLEYKSITSLNAFS